MIGLTILFLIASLQSVITVPPLRLPHPLQLDSRPENKPYYINNVLLKGTEEVRDKLLSPYEFLLVEGNSDPYLSVPILCEINCVPEPLPMDNLDYRTIQSSNNNERSGSEFNGYAALHSLYQIMIKLIENVEMAELSTFTDQLGKSIQNCNCGIDIDSAELQEMIFAIRKNTASYFNEKLFIELNCNQMLWGNNHGNHNNFPRNTYGGQRRFVHGQYRYARPRYEPTLWPQRKDVGLVDRRYPGDSRIEIENQKDFGMKMDLTPEEVNYSVESSDSSNSNDFVTPTTSTPTTEKYETPEPTKGLSWSVGNELLQYDDIDEEDEKSEIKKRRNKQLIYDYDRRKPRYF